MKKIIFLIITIFCISFLTGCGEEESLYDKDKYNVEATFMFNDGILRTGTTDIKVSIKYAYEKSSLICDPDTLYNPLNDSSSTKGLKNPGFNLVGWYLDEELTEKWDFSTDRITEDITLFAKWEKAVKYTYTIIEIVDGKEEVVRELSVDPNTTSVDGKMFSRQIGETHAKKTGYTIFGFYKSSNFIDSERWDYDFVHPCNEENPTVKVYVDYIEGEYALVSNYTELNAATNRNIYLLNDIDCEGQNLKFSNYNGTINGNGYKIHNFVVDTNGVIVRAGIFNGLRDGASISNITFDDFTITISTKLVNSITFYGLGNAATDANVVIDNVTVNGKLIISKDIKFRNDNEDIVDSSKNPFENDQNVTVSSFTSNCTIETEE